MSNLILDPNDLPVELPTNDFWEKPVSRKSFQVMLNQIGKHIADLWAAVDTSNVLINYIMEEHLMKDIDAPEFRKLVDAFVEKKKIALENLRKNAIAQVKQNEG